ncbi:penicillin-binding protein 1C [Polyangium jinanense]|uniref:peptidoglycan glycosyltransferase n=1 Tax=Polyangium jinanense TaxID=2829994 RepID=A0A9X3XJP7_9BACT|nr:penicillin-binding protein 1C [Polyangium jinanense]MDC3989311.1 penicillin-binding protein 1C [Polyangium jinanense]
MTRSRLARVLARWLVPRSRRHRIELALAALLSPILCLGVAAALTPLPPELASNDLAAADPSTVFLDRHGTVLCEVRAKDGTRARPVRLADIDPRVARAVLAAEDKRFYLHPGVDPIAITRAAGQALLARGIVSGGSTLTQQLARTLVPRPRTVVGKLREMALALRIEASLSKPRILEEYLNRVAFGPSLRGVEAASRFYFDKSTRDLSLGEAAALASLPRGPTLYDPRRGTDLLKRRRDRVLERMRAARLAEHEDVDRALGEPLVLAPRGSGLGIPHLRQALLAGGKGIGTDGLAGRATSITTTLDRGLQREIEILAVQTVERLVPRHVTAASVVVLDNETGDILAYVGSPDIENEARLGHNDGVLAKRQPGSTLKPFVYGLGMEIAGFSAATILPDVDLHFPTPDGDYHPNNYDGRFHGPVRVREALASSFNVPAVVAASRVGPERLLARLRDLGFASLDRSARDYGLALALGDGEVRLIELAAAYATLARGGLSVTPRAVREARAATGELLPLPAPPPRRVLDRRATYVLTHILADRHARLATFGENSVLELPFPVAAKTGTSKGFRDNVTVGFTPSVTVAVWVGNFDGSPMSGVSGVTGAGPLFHDAMLAAARLYPERAFERPEGLVDVDICPLSGARPGPDCPHRRSELLPRNTSLATCDMHERVRIDRRNGLRAGPACSDASTDVRVFEHYPPELAAWAENAGRPVAPRASSPFCPESDRATAPSRIRIAFPPDGARFVRDGALAAEEAIRVRIDAPSNARTVRLLVDGRAFVLLPPFERSVPLVPGEHTLVVDADGITSEPVRFSVE